MAHPRQYWTIDLTDEQIHEVAHGGLDRQLSQALIRVKHQVAHKDGPWGIGINGALAELAASLRTGYRWMGLQIGKPGGPDLEHGVEVRSSTRPNEWGIQLKMKDKSKGDAPFILVSSPLFNNEEGDPHCFTLYGWFTAIEGLQKDFRRTEWDDAFQVKPPFLYPMETLDDYVVERNRRLESAAIIAAYDAAAIKGEVNDAPKLRQ